MQSFLHFPQSIKFQRQDTGPNRFGLSPHHCHIALKGCFGLLLACPFLVFLVESLNSAASPCLPPPLCPIPSNPHRGFYISLSGWIGLSLHLGGLNLIYPLNSATTSSPNPLPGFAFAPALDYPFSPVPPRQTREKRKKP